MAKKQQKKRVNKLSIRGNRMEEQFGYFCELVGAPYERRVQHVCDKTGLTKSNVYRNATKYKFMEKAIEKESQGMTQEQVQTIAKTIIEQGVVPKQVTYSAIAEEMKQYGHTMVSTTKELTEAAAALIQYYSKEIRKLTERVGSLTLTDQARLDAYVKKVEKYEELIAPYIRPQAVTSYLRLSGMEQAMGVLPEDAELGLLTPQKLLSNLEQVGFACIVENLQVAAVIKAEIEADGRNIPEVDGRKVKDEVNEINTETMSAVERKSKMQKDLANI